MERPSLQLKHDSRAYFYNDTMMALASPLGGAMAIVRVSGPKTAQILERLTGKPWEAFTPRRLTRCHLKNKRGQPFDDVMIAVFKMPNSYTGEDLAEIYIHGNSVIATALFDEARQVGIRQALPGEFSFRAVRNGKMDLNQAEAVKDLVDATNESALELAIEKMSGLESRILSELATDLRALAAMCEVGIDFSDQEIDELNSEQMRHRAEEIKNRLKILADSFVRGSRIQDGISVAFVGAPNAGKSSFFNALLGEERSIVSALPGTTRDIIRERITLESEGVSVTFKLEDTAGMRDSTEFVENEGIQRAIRSAQKADLVVLIFDVAGQIGRLEEILNKVNRSVSERFLGVLSKCDSVSEERVTSVISELRRCSLFKGMNWVPTSAKTGFGIQAAAKKLIELTHEWTGRHAGEVLLTRLDHLRAVEQSMDCLDRAVRAESIELIAADLRQGLHALGPLIGETLPDDILRKIFSEFCIGK